MFLWRLGKFSQQKFQYLSYEPDSTRGINWQDWRVRVDSNLWKIRELLDQGICSLCHYTSFSLERSSRGPHKNDLHQNNDKDHVKGSSLHGIKWFFLGMVKWCHVSSIEIEHSSNVPTHSLQSGSYSICSMSGQWLFNNPSKVGNLHNLPWPWSMCMMTKTLSPK